jgi:hypothetical protein
MLLMPMVIGLATAAASRAASWSVLPDGSGDVATIQAAIDAAQAGDVVELGDGTFTGDGNRDLDFGGTGLVLRSARGVAEACVIECGGSTSDPHRAFHFHTAEPADALVADLTIRGGLADMGGAVAIFYKASPALRAVFTANQALMGALSSSGDLRSAPSPTAFLQNRERNEPSGGGRTATVHRRRALPVRIERRQRLRGQRRRLAGSTAGSPIASSSATRHQETDRAGGGLHTHDGGPQLVNRLSATTPRVRTAAICCTTMRSTRGLHARRNRGCSAAVFPLRILRDNASAARYRQCHHRWAHHHAGCYAHAEIG